MKYRKKPVVVEAMQFDGLNVQEVMEFTGLKPTIIDTAWKVRAGAPGAWFDIDTLEGAMRASKGDYIIRGVKGELYPCKPDIFELTYELVDDANTEACDAE